MKNLSIILLVLFFQTYAFGQLTIPAGMRASNSNNGISELNVLNENSFYALRGVPPGDVVGDYYLNEKWNKANILLYQSEMVLEGYNAKYDIKNDIIEIQTSVGVRILDVKEVRNLVWIDSLTIEPQYFVNAHEFNKGIGYDVLLQVLAKGPIPLLKQTELVITPPSYNVALSIGSKDTKIYKKSIILYSKEGELFEIKNKKDILKASGDLSKEVEVFIKSNKLKVSKDEGLRRVFEFINSKKS
jgi:hypothetical protein